ncbi:MAG: hypothetical protein QGI68_14270 [Pseudomonadales bacterium]|jgi:hypothetical protein|nr:hypothetical protein [Pseudomonadales bacterium]MDP7596712.1 hypothetical protein [Pseudomonadales bacterium]|tara:strand:+ start:960 stop:1385 length:426 start_codon:yes stop_codon:yes gene_type:complete
MKLSEFILDRPLREVIVTYVASTWGGLEIIVTISDLSGFSILIPQIISVLILIGFVLLLSIRWIGMRSRTPKRPRKPWSRLTRNLVHFAMFFALLPMSFVFSGANITWIMWQDAPVFATIFTVLAVLTLFAVVVSIRRDAS